MEINVSNDINKATFLGEIPSQWKVLRIKNLFQEMDSRSETGSEELLSVSHYTGVTLKRESLENEDDHISNAESLVGYKLVAKGDLVINIMLAWNGSLGISPHNGMTSPAYCVYRIKGNNNPEYFAYLFITNLFKAEFRRNSTGIIDSRLRLYSDKFFSIFSVVPPKEEQDDVVQYIKAQEEKTNLFIQKKQDFIELLQEQRRAIINKAVTLGANKNIELNGTDWVKNLPSHWKKGRLKNYSTIKGRIGFRGYTTSDLVDEGEGVLTLGATHINQVGLIDIRNPVFISWEKYHESPEIKVSKNDVIIVQRGSTCGKAGLVQNDFGEMTINPSVVLVKNIKINSEFLLYFLLGDLIRDNIRQFVSNTAIPMLSQFQIGNFPIFCPPMEEQEQIVEYIKAETKAIDTAISKTEREIELIREYKEAMIAELVMGKRKIEK
ncbi:MAG: restriction endonuclease subunit S [Saprospiraceae bacterium]